MVEVDKLLRESLPLLRREVSRSRSPSPRQSLALAAGLLGVALVAVAWLPHLQIPDPTTRLLRWWPIVRYGVFQLASLWPYPAALAALGLVDREARSEPFALLRQTGISDRAVVLGLSLASLYRLRLPLMLLALTPLLAVQTLKSGPATGFVFIPAHQAIDLGISLVWQMSLGLLGVSLAVALRLRWGQEAQPILLTGVWAFPRQHILTRALQEYGRLVKTIFILRYLLNESYQRRIGSQLNKGEKLHTLRAHLHSASRGLLRKKNPDEHLNQANCLNLIVNAIIAWNTIYMQAAIDYLRGQGQDISDEALSHLSPVRFEHINIHGKYSFEISVPLSNNGLRPLLI